MGEQPFFLTEDEVRRLTGRAVKTKQVEFLKTQGLPFRVNALGQPIIVRSVIEGRSAPTAPPPSPRRAWAPALAGV